MFMGWFDPSKGIPESDKLKYAIKRYVEKFGSEPVICLTSCADAEALEKQGVEFPVRPVTFIARHVYYVGVEEEVEAVA